MRMRRDRSTGLLGKRTWREWGRLAFAALRLGMLVARCVVVLLTGLHDPGGITATWSRVVEQAMGGMRSVLADHATRGKAN
ncbi:hypothetical protein GCM10017688_53730 [Streptomyces ramulosus]